MKEIKEFNKLPLEHNSWLEVWQRVKHLDLVGEEFIVFEFTLEDTHYSFKIDVNYLRQQMVEELKPLLNLNYSDVYTLRHQVVQGAYLSNPDSYQKSIDIVEMLLKVI